MANKKQTLFLLLFRLFTDWVREAAGKVGCSSVRSKRDSSLREPTRSLGSEREEKASARSGRNDNLTFCVAQKMQVATLKVGPGGVLFGAG